MTVPLLLLALVTILIALGAAAYWLIFGADR